MTLETVSEDETGDVTTPVKPKSVKKKKPMGDDDATKKKKKKKQSDNSADGDEAATNNTSKSKKKKKKATSIGTASTGSASEDDLTQPLKPKSMKKNTAGAGGGASNEIPDRGSVAGRRSESFAAARGNPRSPSPGPASGREGRSPSPRRGGLKGRSPSPGPGGSKGRSPSPGPGGRSTAMNQRRSVSPGPGGRRGRSPSPGPGGRGTGRMLNSASAHTPGRGAGRGGAGGRGPGPGRPQSMSAGLNSNSAHNANLVASNHRYGAPGRPASMMRANGRSVSGRGGRGRGGTSSRGGLDGRSSHGAIGNGSSHAYRAPGKPASILRSSTHANGRRSVGGAVIVSADGSIRHIARDPSSSGLGQGSCHLPKRKNSLANPNLERSSSIDSFDIDNDDIEADFADSDKAGGTIISGIPGVIGELTKSIRGLMDSSVHSGLGAGGISVHERTMDRRAGLKTSLSQFGGSTRSVLTLDMDYSDDNACVRLMRYIRLMPPHPNEKPLKKKIRITTWAALILDFLAAIVAITTYDGVTTCCGAPMMDMAGTFPWEKIITTVTYFYICLIVLEVLPVIRDGFPFNLFNPFVGFLITFAVFFDDSMVEAVIMWVIEAMAVTCEVYIFRLRSFAYQERLAREQKVENDIKTLRSVKKKVKQQYESGRQLNISLHSLGSVSMDDDSFHDETGSTPDDMTTGTDISKVRETKLYRERRMLRESNAKDRLHLRYHFIGVCVNCFLVGLSLLIICVIAKNKGLCIVDMEPPNVFKNDQLDRCFSCKGGSGVCEICNADGTSQCYYPYG